MMWLSSWRLLPARPPAIVITPLVRVLVALGLTPTTLSFLGVAGNIGAAVLIATGDLVAGGIVTLFASALDMLDGALARATGQDSKAGAMLDSVLDRISEAVVLCGIVAYSLMRDNDEHAMLGFVAVVGSLLVSYVRARAEGLGIALTDGLFTRAERVALTSAALILGWLGPALWLLAVLTSLTAAQRLTIAMRKLQEGPPA